MEQQSPNPLSHLTPTGEAHMVNVSEKPLTARQATARASVRMCPDTLCLIRDQAAIKGDVLATARIAGIMAAKHTPDLIPLCHPLPIDGVEVDIELVEPDLAIVTATVRTVWRTGVEMEALTAAAAAALTIYDMCKAVDRAMIIENILLLEKSGGRSGLFQRPSDFEPVQPPELMP